MVAPVVAPVVASEEPIVAHFLQSYVAPPALRRPYDYQGENCTSSPEEDASSSESTVETLPTESLPVETVPVEEEEPEPTLEEIQAVINTLMEIASISPEVQTGIDALANMVPTVSTD